MLLPKRVKYRRVHRGRMKGKASRGNTVTYGEWGLQAIEPSWITSNHLLHFTELFLAFRQGALGLRKFSIGDFRCAGQITHPFGPFTFQLERCV